MEFTDIIRVRYSETDAMGVVYHANYLVWMEIGRTEFLRNSGFPYRDMEDSGVLVPVSEIHTKYLSPAKYDDEIVVTTKLASYSRVKCEFSYKMVRKSDGVEILRGSSVHAFTDRNLKPVNIKKVMPELWNKMSSVV